MSGSWEWRRREMGEKIESNSQEVTGATHHPALYLGLRLQTQDFTLHTSGFGLRIVNKNWNRLYVLILRNSVNNLKRISVSYSEVLYSADLLSLETVCGTLKYLKLRHEIQEICEQNSKEKKKRVAEDSLDGKTKPLLNTHWCH